MCRHGLFQSLFQDMGVDLRGGYVGMTEHLLNRTQIGAVGEEV